MAETNNENQTSTNVSIPTKENFQAVQVVGPPLAQFFGRRVLYDDFSEEELNSTNVEDNIKVIVKILNDVWSLHIENAGEIKYLEDYYRGYQPILGKTKEVRPSINNTVVENNAYFVVNFKVGYVFGEPIQYVQRGDVSNPEVGILNSYVLAEDKYAKDSELAESIYTNGIAHRLVLPEINEDSPFDIENLDSKTTFIVYSSNIKNKPLIGVTYTKGVMTSVIKGSIYTRTGYYEFDTTPIGGTFNVRFVKPHYLGIIPIFEYHINKWRQGIVEVVMSIFNALNRIASGDLDGLEQYVQSIMVFINQEIDADTYKDVLNLGAVEINTADPARPADVKLIQNELDHANTEVLHNRLLNLALTIIGIPNITSKSTGGDTGEARALGDGWTMAEKRAKQDEMSFKKCSKEEIKLILKICRLTPNSGIDTLTIKDIDQKMPRNKSDNFLTKAQGMMNLISSGVSPDVAFNASGAFSDSNEAYTKSMEFYGGIENWINRFISKQEGVTGNMSASLNQRQSTPDVVEENDDEEEEQKEENTPKEKE